MKKMIVLILVSFMAFIHADDISNPAVKLIEKLNIQNADETEYSIPPEDIWKNLVKDNIKIEGTELLLRETSVSYIQDSETICTVRVEFANSEKEAVLDICGILMLSSAPEVSIMNSVKIWKAGPGSICIVTTNFDEETQKIRIPNSQLTFIRDGLVVRVSNRTADCEIGTIAKLIDEQIILTVEKMKNGEVTTQTEEDTKAIAATRADDIKNHFENRAIKLISELNILSVDETEYSIPPKEVWRNVEKDNIKLEGTECSFTGSDKAFFRYTRDGSPFYAIKIQFANSEKEAVLNICRELVRRPQSISDIIKIVKVWKEGPGSLCVVNSQFDEETLKSSVPYPEFVFIRNGIVVRIINDNLDCEIGKVARLIDEQILLATAKVKQELLDAQQSSESYQWEMDKKESMGDAAITNPVENDNTATDKPVTENTNNHTLVIILLLVVALLVIGGGAVYYMHCRAKRDS